MLLNADFIPLSINLMMKLIPLSINSCHHAAWNFIENSCTFGANMWHYSA